MQEIIKSIIPVIGVIVGALLTYFFSKSNETKKQKTQLRNQAYVDYIRSVSEIKFSQKYSEREKEKEIIKVLCDSKVRIAIYGSKLVNTHMAKFSRMGSVIDSMESEKCFLDLIMQMRKECSDDRKTKIDFNDLSQIVLGKDILSC